MNQAGGENQTANSPTVAVTDGGKYIYHHKRTCCRWKAGIQAQGNHVHQDPPIGQALPNRSRHRVTSQNQTAFSTDLIPFEMRLNLLIDR